MTNVHHANPNDLEAILAVPDIDPDVVAHAVSCLLYTSPSPRD